MDIIEPLSKSGFPAQSAAFTATAASTASFPPGPGNVLVWATQACFVEVGEGATATTASTPIPANTVVIFKVPNRTSGPWVVSAVRVSVDGTVYCKPINLL